jgi:hypothetical protein
MKRIAILYLMLLSALGVDGQAVFPYSNTFYYLGQPSNTLNQIESSLYVDGRIILVVTAVDTSLGQYLNIVEVDSSGNAISITTIPHTCRILYTLPNNSIIQDSDGNFVVASNAVFLEENPSDGYLIKLNSDLDTMWTKTYDLPPQLAGCPSDTFVSNYFYAIKQCANYDFIIAGSYSLNCHYGSIYDRTCLLRVNTDGNILWWKTYPDITGVYDIEISSDSGFFICGGDNIGPPFVAKLDSLGSILWEVPCNTQIYPSAPLEVEFLNDSIILVASALWVDLIHYNRNFVLSKININSQQKVFERVYHLYPSYDCYTIHQSVSLAITESKDIIVGGNALVVKPDSTDVSYKGFILKLDSDGDSIWTKYYNYGNFEDNCQFNDILIMDDGGFFAAGFHDPWGGSKNTGAWIVRTDSNGYAPGAYPTGIYKPDPTISQLKVFPNPTTDVSWLELDDIPTQARTGIIRLYDMKGNLTQTIKLIPGVSLYKIDLQTFKPGLYLVSILLEDGSAYQAKLVVK